ncbi:threonine synthase-like 2 [Mizuhopecten yessoensis]|uniref:Threonine synthase-like 2 n=1 Tax=Mizuhopecten yessoensis TaxID=6573 RepID=A0A210PV44_MIZYE|nr:threonine synthase-like 2 [Mizuhopecten yessoensis]XP_021374602.1 threonine synthase-like 2 [Mizuhopecten yessoensis]XP_021374603.1 threonine synthase-like 2 [Mizuhopecten yessoensis]OWF40335.1 Threonine synthase-like 2 [Mizuhopecten yessoensis]
MRYCSTRGGVTGLTFEEALYTGYAEDGGIILPETIPTITTDTLKSWSKLSYVGLVKEIVPLFVGEDEIPKDELNGLLDKAFGRFTHPDVTPISKLNDGLNIIELFHGVTWAFKDLALSCVGQFLEYFLNKRQKHLTIIVGTSGDTGSAAIEAIRGLKWVDIVVLLPKGRCSRVQEHQMTSVMEDNVHVFRVEGSSDDLDLPIKKVFMDIPFKRQHNLTSINSINWARVMVQTAHYIYSYLQMCPSCDGEVEIVIPTGACGNVTSGCLARLMGVPLRLVCAVTTNDIVDRTVRNGDYSMADTVTQTLATAMDIQVPYNMERIWYMVTGGNAPRIKALMDEFESTGKVQLPTDIVEKTKEIIVETFVANDDVVRQTMRRTFEKDQYHVCPHTAIGVAYHYRDLDSKQNTDRRPPRVIIATASVKKFQEAVISAGLTPVDNAEVASLLTKETKSQEMKKEDNWEEMLRKTIEMISVKSK